MASGSYMTPIYSRSQSEVQGDLHTLVLQCHIETHEIHRGKGPEREHAGGWSETSHLSSSSTNLTRGLAARRLFKVPPCRKGTTYLQTSKSHLGFELRPYDTAVSVADHCTGWVT
ncbi:hypothetical protein TNCV_4596111 [Trichonephila clavipes]|uniref:Uncharacterized protein n=1 Tax=Trichonephila clavipes TaxID=2585209 RepID=A0A8X7BJW7_TRICX|nr:hypothetical protein TNCV_4596111 [Trichonephila clavipes]